ncbi:cytochrome P450 71AU50 [Cucumis melo]|uniref:Cytochrome P450 71AU50 n=2 Tax=Cucumis melo TaxID=3656 RepID=A0A1S3CCX4_CUCME|nr:cytochrome P450 71AU50 [Cucumis melo]
MAWLWIWILIIISLLIPLSLLKINDKKLPPGPKGFPIFGSFHLLGKLPHRDLHTLSQKYGPIMHIKLGIIPTIIVSSPNAAELFLRTYDHVFASRPQTYASNYLFYGQKNFGFSKYGSYWRNMRKMCTHELLSNQKVSMFEPIRRNQVGLLVENLKEAARTQVAVNLSSKVLCVVRDMTCLMVFGKKYVEDQEMIMDEKSFHDAVKEVVQLVATPNLSDFIPCVAWFDFQGINRRAKSLRNMFDGFLERIIEEHLDDQFKNENKNQDFVDVLLGLMGSQNNEYNIDPSTIKALILEMVITAMDTTATNIDWAIVELIRHPHIMKKMQQELDKVVGLQRMVLESDLEHLQYLNMVIKEVLRLHPPVPLLVPHESLQDCTTNGFHIPKQSRIIVNAWAIGRDPTVWNDPQKFFPERFIDSEVDLKGKDFELIPFGSGRRCCPGMHLGLTMVRLLLAQLVHAFYWELPNGILPNQLDMTEEFGLTCPRAQHLMVTPIYRLIL